MSGDMFDDQSPLLSPLCFLESPEPCIPLLDCLPNSTVETENPYVDPFGLIPVSTIDETNLLLSSQQSNLVTYQETSTLVPKPLEMHQNQNQNQNQNQHRHQNQNQHQHQHQHQNQYQHQNQHQHRVVQQQQQQQQLINSHETWLQDKLSNMLNTIQQESSVFTRNQTEIGQQVRQANNGFAHPTVTNSPLQLQNRFLPVPLIPQHRSNAFGSLFPQTMGSARPQNYMPYQTPHQQVTSSFGMYPQQPRPPVFVRRQNEPPNIRMVNNNALTRIHPLQNQTNMIPPFNAVPQRTIPRPQMSSRLFTRQHGGMQTSVNQSPLRFRLPNINNRQAPVRPNANAIIPPQGEILGCRRRSYPSRFEFGQSSSSSAQRRRIVPASENVGSTSINHGNAEQRGTNTIYDPRYESFGLCIDPHLRKYAMTL
ncbi:hypothetical protein AtNW77_Chr1g0080081 [Arabidopsis thaliana]|uniref:Uncharacterized protein n=1 Tax=Arabidopsis thaliana x Arabidopsis arenosa TaxID=1240361 RepID=A0A8T2GXP2_9BRAS|nr:hypothetical protein ISN45_At01g068830 [Arabidopsis thaliana x Arabidopsis arenosa]